MADNYLEKRYEEVFGHSGPGRAGRSLTGRPSLETLLTRNRSFRGYDKTYVVHELQLKSIVSVNTKIASAVNAQRLRFHIVAKGAESEVVLRHIRMGRALPELHLPLPGTEPEAFIIVCSSAEETPGLDIDLGISLQSMLLKAVDLGLGGLIIRNFDAGDLSSELELKYFPLAVLAIGKPAEHIELVPVREGDNLNYYRNDGIHFVPKLIIDDLLF